MTDDLCARLTALSRSEHSDLSVAAEAVEEIGRLRVALAECSDGMAGWIDAQCPATSRAAFPSEQRRYERDMAPVIRARALLAGNGKG